MLLLRKTDVLKTSQRSKILRKKILRFPLALRSKKVQGIFGETFVLALLSSAVFNSFEVDFRYVMNVSPNILAKN